MHLPLVCRYPEDEIEEKLAEMRKEMNAKHAQAQKKSSRCVLGFYPVVGLPLGCSSRWRNTMIMPVPKHGARCGGDPPPQP